MLAPAPVAAKTLAGVKHAYVLLGIRDYDDYNKTGPSMELGVNLPITEKLDITPFFRHEEVDSTVFFSPYEFESDTLAARGDFRIKEIDHKYTVYAGGAVGFTRTKVTSTTTIPGFWFMPTRSVTTTVEEDDLLFQVHGGLLMNLAEQVGLKPECAYIRAGDYDDVNCGVLFNYDPNDMFSVLAAGKFFFNDRDLSYSIGGVFKF